jgi:hypothetical protein
MSVAVAIDRVREEITKTDRAPYLLTVSDDARPHSVAVACSWDGDALVISVGARTLANARARGLVTLLWPPKEAGGYTLIVDASVESTSDAGAAEPAITVRPSRAVLHRPAAARTKPGCDADCVPLEA